MEGTGSRTDPADAAVPDSQGLKAVRMRMRKIARGCGLDVVRVSACHETSVVGKALHTLYPLQGQATSIGACSVTRGIP